MATRQGAYDDPVYQALTNWTADIPATLNSTTQGKFTAATTMLIKSFTVTCTAMGTAGGSDIANGSIYAVKITQGTSTATFGLNTWGTGGAGNTLGTYTATTTVWPLANSTLSPGDMLYARKGTDSSLTATVSFEMYVSPGASLTS